MTQPEPLRNLIDRLRRPQTTVRWRLTLVYGGLFLTCGAALLAITYALVAHARPPAPDQVFVARQLQTQPANPVPTTALPFPAQVTLPSGAIALIHSPAGGQVIRTAAHGQRVADLHNLEIESGIALAIMAIIAAGLGWLVAGRVLRPLRTITATTQQISEANLHERLALTGPRDELRGLADTIDGLLGRLEGAFDAQRRFVANASHELRTPLTATRALLEMALSDPHMTKDMFRETCRQVLEESEQQEQLIDALLALAQGQRGIEQRESIDLAAVTRDELESAQRQAGISGVTIDTELNPATFSGDRRLVKRLVSNLLQNAIRHNFQGGNVKVAVDAPDGHAVFTIANTGPVVQADDVERLLQPFQRAAPDRTGHRDGIGLGLSIAAAVAAAHSASLDVAPGERGGLRIKASFPA